MISHFSYARKQQI